MSFTLMHLILRVCYRSFIRQTYLFLSAVFVREIFLLSGTPRSVSSTVLSNMSKAWNPMPLHRISSVGWHFSTVHSILLNSAARELLMHSLRNKILVQRAHNSHQCENHTWVLYFPYTPHHSSSSHWYILWGVWWSRKQRPVSISTSF